MEWIFEDIEDKYFENVPIIKRVDNFLAHIDKKGLKLTQNGNLPTKVVKDIMKVDTSKIESYHKRFIEAEFPRATFVKELVKTARLIRKQHNKYFLTKKGEKYLNFSKKEKFLFLLETLLDDIRFDNFYSQLSASLFFGAIHFFKKNEKRFFDIDFLMDKLLSYNQELSSIYKKMIENNMPTHYLKVQFKMTLLDFMMFEFGLIEKNEDIFVYEYQKTELLDKAKDFELKKIELLNEEEIIELSKETPDIAIKFFEYISSEILEEEPKFNNKQYEKFYDSLFATLEMLLNIKDKKLLQEMVESMANGFYKSIDKKNILVISKNVKAIANYIQKSYEKISKDLKEKDTHLEEMLHSYKFLLKYLTKMKKFRNKEKEILKDFIKISVFIILYMLAI